MGHVKKHITMGGINVLTGKLHNAGKISLYPNKTDPIITACLNFVAKSIDTIFGFQAGTNIPIPDQKVTCKRCISVMKKHGL
jgi:hypothetical protein